MALIKSIRRRLYLAVLILLPSVLHAQVAPRDGIQLIDSLLSILPHLHNDSNKVKALNILSFRYFTYNPDKGLYYGNQSAALAIKIGWKKGEARAYNSIGANYWSKNNFVAAEEFYLRSLKINEALGDKKEITRNTHNIADIFDSGFNYPKALEYYMRAFGLAESMKDDQVACGLASNIAYVYTEEENYPKALSYLAKAIAITTRHNWVLNTATYKAQVGEVESKMKNYENAIRHEKEAIAIFREYCAKDPVKENVPKTINSLALIYFERGDYRSAKKYYRQALYLYQKLAGSWAIKNAAVCLRGMAISDFKMADTSLLQPTNKRFENANRRINLDNVRDTLLLAINLSLRCRDWVNLKESYLYLSKVQELRADYPASLQAHKQYIIYKDSLSNTERDKEVTIKNLDFEYGRQKDSLRTVNSLQTVRLQSLVQERELDKLRSKQQWFYVIAVAVGLCLLVFFLFYRNWINQTRLQSQLANERAIYQLNEAEQKSKVVQATLTALMSQLNPHFIFNCLNSIKLYVEKNEMEAASLYISKFSKLIRNILDSARSEKVMLNSELEVIKLYLDMERMRLKEKLTYEFDIDERLNTGFIEVPPLLIQPYVENAIWHGLMQKAEGGKINISVKRSDDEKYLVITVTDDGVGRETALSLKENDPLKRTSHGSKLNDERVTLFNAKYNTTIEVIIDDLYDNTRPTGTRVTIKLLLNEIYESGNN